MHKKMRRYRLLYIKLIYAENYQMFAECISVTFFYICASQSKRNRQCEKLLRIFNITLKMEEAHIVYTVTDLRPYVW